MEKSKLTVVLHNGGSVTEACFSSMFLYLTLIKNGFTSNNDRLLGVRFFCHHRKKKHKGRLSGLNSKLTKMLKYKTESLYMHDDCLNCPIFNLCSHKSQYVK